MPAKAAGQFHETSKRTVPERVNRSNRGRYLSAFGPTYAVTSSPESGDDGGTKDSIVFSIEAWMKVLYCGPAEV
ncbi:MAG TPA: hypothetical protein DCP41_11230 [Deltaproteobacteria bacterium]|nr:hypothetical protein [Deltaproteobacteria bacterium]